MKTIQKIYDIIFKLVEGVAVVFMWGMVCIVAYSVFMRYVLHNAPRWGDELALLCMVWFGFLSAAVALKEDRHIRINFWGMFLSKKMHKGLELIVHGIGLVALLVFFKYSVHLVGLAGMTKMTGSRLPLSYLYMAEPVGIGMLIVAMIGRIGDIIANR
ncbi:TRAP transporter small permease [Clostridium sp. AM58-1XD]|uniref:TRAP transporter small permease n=1 Tax=Clostridium sp. AM58-1XD TaxID=2292307 RepID=UPI000E4CCE0B|nr:TRAP transporter small permease [Clostridium sp. AM58-1XD]RGZ00647.1 TRAP transporter small permease [Clostridium sp. AM58-1XD]